MPTGHDVLRSAYRFHGEPYSTAPGRTSQTSGYKDCSGLVYAALVGVGIFPGGTVSTTLETWAVNNGGRRISRAEALHTPGAGLAIWGIGSNGHIGFSVGDGRAYETPSDAGRRVGYSRFGRNAWTRFFTWPGVDHGNPGTTTQGDDDLTPEQAQQLGELYLAVIGNDAFGAPKAQSVRQRVAEVWSHIKGAPALGVPSMAEQLTKVAQSGPSGGLSEAQVRAIVRSELDATGLAKK